MWLRAREDNSQSPQLDTIAAKPISDEEFGALMAALGAFEEQPVLAVAVSGGPDSLALTLLASRWAKLRGGRVIGLTVDHDLRTGSAEEADQTGRWLKSYDIDHDILKWEGDKPKPGFNDKRDKRAMTDCGFGVVRQAFFTS